MLNSNQSNGAPLASSPIITNEDESVDEDDFDDEDEEDEEDDEEDEDDEDLDEEIEDDEEHNEDDSKIVSLDSNCTAISNSQSGLKSPKNMNLNSTRNTSHLGNSNNKDTTGVHVQRPHTSTSLEPNDKFQFSNSSNLHRAPGTSICPHTARIDIRRVRSCRDLTQAQILYTQNDFVFKEKLGEGFFANVKKIVSKVANKEMVLKELKLNSLEYSSSGAQQSNEPANITSTSDDAQSNVNSTTNNNNKNLPTVLNYAELNAAHKSFLKEAQVLRNLDHPNVIKLLGIMFTKQKHLNLVLEYIGGGTLKDIIHNISTPLPWKLRVGYAKDIAAGMQYLHSLNIIHRDLKSDNCLVRENGRSVVVADFGLSRIISNNYTTAATSQNNKTNKTFTNNTNNSTNNIKNNTMDGSTPYLKVNNNR